MQSPETPANGNSEPLPFRHVDQIENPFQGSAGASARDTAINFLFQGDMSRTLGFDIAILPPPIKADANSSDWTFGLADSDQAYWNPDRLLQRGDTVEAVMVAIQQRAGFQGKALDLFGAGLSMTLFKNESEIFELTEATATTELNPEVDSEVGHSFQEFVSAPDFGKAVIAILAQSLGIEEDAIDPQNVRLVFFRDASTRSLRFGISALTSIPLGDSGEVGHVVLLDITDRNDIRTVERTPQIAAATTSAKVFAYDPVTTSGDVGIRPGLHNGRLRGFRRWVDLHDLQPVAGGYKLEGPRVAVESPNPLGTNPPTSPDPLVFEPRTNEFAAVSAYYHADAMMRLVQDLGHSYALYFSDVTLPIILVHRAKLLAGSPSRDGIGINAYCVPERVSGKWKVRILFGLADLTDWNAPLGIAADPRWVWHEFCHLMILAATDRTELPFAHSAGDALAAVMSDPEWALANQAKGLRGTTFPFVGGPFRRHNRCVACGWGWNGSLYERPKAPDLRYDIRDPTGYRAEQILSTTLFRLYEAIGGAAVRADGSPDRARRWSAAHYVCHLIVGAIYLLPKAANLPNYGVEVFAAKLQNVDLSTRTFTFQSDAFGANLTTRRVGGAVRKVIRWAFEMQGLYQGSGTGGPVDSPGLPPDVDVFIEDAAGRQGEYEFTESWQAADSSLWVRQTPDGQTMPETPIVNTDNAVYVVVENRGSASGMVPTVTVEMLAASGAAIDTWRSPATSTDWNQLPAGAGAVTSAAVAVGSKVRFGPFTWQPANGLNAIFVRATTAKDPSTADPNPPRACATGPTPIADLVPHDNNLAYRVWQL